MAQFCLAGPQEIAPFKSLMDSIAQEYQMAFTDRSGATEAELIAIGSDNFKVARPHVNIGADRNGEFSFGAGNLGMPANQIVIGFNGTNPVSSRAFSDAAVHALAAHWTLHEVPKDRGAFPLPKCD